MEQAATQLAGEQQALTQAVPATSDPVQVEQAVASTPVTPVSFLPRIPVRPSRSLKRGKFLFYGPPKIGKSTLASRFPRPMFLATEEGLSWLTCMRVQIVDWDTTEPHIEIREGQEVTVCSFCSACGMIEMERPDYIDTIVVDTADNAYTMCMDHVCATLGVTHPQDLDYGQGWAAVKAEWQRVLTKMSRWPYGLVFTSHVQLTEIRGKVSRITNIEPSVQSAGRKVLQALVDTIVYCYMDERAVLNEAGEVTGEIKEHRIMQCAPSNIITAGDRTGLLPPELEMSYDALKACFDETAETK